MYAVKAFSVNLNLTLNSWVLNAMWQRLQCHEYLWSSNFSATNVDGGLCRCDAGSPTRSPGKTLYEYVEMSFGCSPRSKTGRGLTNESALMQDQRGLKTNTIKEG